jgi:two-component system, response regulator PdtaR
MMSDLLYPEPPRFALPHDEKRADASKAQADTPAQQADAGVRLLIVEDDYLIGTEAESALADAGFDIIGIAIDAEEALAMARQHKPALAIMDIRLAGRRDGIETAADLFSELGIRCIFATAHDNPQVRARAEPCRPLGWLTKPYTMSSLVNVVRAAASRPRI